MPNLILEQMGGGSFVDGMYPNFTQGPIKVTNQSLDLAIKGEGFFGCLDGERVLYTRAGNLERSMDGTLVTSTGMPVLDEAGGTISLTTADVEIGADGVR